MRCCVALLVGLAVLVFSAIAQPPKPEVKPEIPVKGQAPNVKRPDVPEIFLPSVGTPVQAGVDGFTIHLDAEFALETFSPKHPPMRVASDEL